MEKFDVIIIGGGPSGASAALYTARGGLNTAIIHNGQSALIKAHAIQNYYGAGVISGGELYELGLKQAADVGARIISDQVTFVQSDVGGFTVSCEHGEYECAKLVLCSGSARKKPNIVGLEKFEGKGVSYCAVCDGFFYRKKTVALIGGGAFAEHEYGVLSKLCSVVYVCTNGEQSAFSAPSMYTQKIEAIEGDGRASSVLLADGTRLSVDGVFVAVGTLGSGQIARAVGILTAPDGSIITDSTGMTNVDGLYAAGDCTAGIKQIAKAVADGMVVGMAITKSLVRHS